jgi:hypothetical protein
MKSPRTILVSTAIPLLLTSLRLSAGELPFNAPETERAKESAPLLHQTARALNGSPSSAALRIPAGKQMSNLWLFPTADANTVFARYNLTSDEGTEFGTVSAAKEHLAVLTVRGDRIVESRELTSSPAELASDESARLHWTAAIGTGYAARSTATKPNVMNSRENNTDGTNSFHGTTALPHWTATIGSGTAASSTSAATDTKGSLSSGMQPVVATAHWTSKIGSGHASDSNSPVYASLADAR